VQGDGIDDVLFLSRESRETQRNGIRFAGRYGAVLRRPGRTTLVLLDGADVAVGAHRLAAPGEKSVAVG
jgi:hypothetical protein